METKPAISSMPSKVAIFHHWKDKLDAHGFFIDWGEPGCWACGFHYGTKYDIQRSNASRQQIERGWEQIPLQRCHIVPRSLGGPDTADNLFLMCRECHDLAPNTGIAALFFEWARAQSHLKRESGKITLELETCGITQEKQEIFLEIIRSPAFNAWVRNKLGLHRPQYNYAPISSRLTTATFVGLAVYYHREQIAESALS